MPFSRTVSQTPGSSKRAIALKATMYFAFGQNALIGLRSKTTFQAILNGERTSTTRFPAWPGYERWRSAKAGDLVRFYEDRHMRGRYVDVIIESVQKIDLARCSAEEVAAWSQAEGWSAAYGRQLGQRQGAGLQVRYRPAE